jgi:hypothetical protein
MSHLKETFSGKEGWKDLLDIFRNKGRTKDVPCPKDTGNPREWHRIINHGWTPIRFRCNLKTCHRTLAEAEALRWFGTLVLNGHVPKIAVGMSPALGQGESVMSQGIKAEDTERSKSLHQACPN